MKTSSTRRSLIALARRILHSYFASSSLDLLLAYLAPDVVWLGAGREMSAEGRQRVGDIFRASANRLIPCVMSQETYRAKALTEDLWLVEGSCQLRTDSSYKVYLQEYQRCTFIFRRCQEDAEETEKSPWEIIYIHNSIAYRELQSHEMFAWTEGLRNYKRLHQPDISLLTLTDKAKMLYLFRSVYEALSEELQEVLLMLAQMPDFTAGEAGAFCHQASDSERLLSTWEKNPFLAFHYDAGKYTFHPGFASFLQKEFRKYSYPWQQAMWCRICDGYLQEGAYKEAFSFAVRAKDSSRILQAVAGGGLAVLYFQPVETLLDIFLQEPDHSWMVHTGACLRLLLFINLTAGPRKAAVDRRRYLDIVADHTAFSASAQAALYVLEGLDHLPVVQAMLPYFQKARSLCQQTGVRLPYDYMKGVTQGVFGQLVAYWQRPGELSQEIQCLRQLYDCCGQIIEGCDAALWKDAIIAEEQYLLGHISVAKALMKPFLQGPLDQEDGQQRAIIALFLLPRIALFEKNMDDFAECQRVCRRLLDIVTDDLLLTDLKITSAFVSCLLEEPSEKQSEIHEQLELLNRHPSLYDTFMSLRHRILLTMRKYQQLQLILDPQTLEGDSPVATMRKLYDSILLAIVEEQLGKMDKAKVFFAKALAMAEPDQVVMPFAEHALFCPQCLEWARQKQEHADFMAKVDAFSLEQVPVIKPVEDALTPREQFIINMVSQGKTNQEIAKALNIAEITVKKRLSQLYQRFGVTNRTGLIHKFKGKA